MFKIKDCGLVTYSFNLNHDSVINIKGRYVPLLVGNRVLARKKILTVFGIKIWTWYENIRTIPVHEWARAATCDFWIDENAEENKL